MISKFENAKVMPQEWGCLTWLVSNEQGNSDKITLGECRIKPGKENPRHQHPNCDEILLVNKGKIMHTFGDERMEMNEGDTITVPAGIVHNAINVGEEECVLTIVFTSADRKTLNEV